MAQDQAKLMLAELNETSTTKIYLYIVDPFESKYQLLTNIREKAEIKQVKITSIR